MIVIGTVLVVLAVLLTLGIVFTNGPTAPDLTVLGVSVSHVSVGALFLTGVVTGVVALLGIGLLLGGGTRRRHKRAAQKRQVTGARHEASSLEQENVRLREQLSARQDSAGGSPDGSARL